MTPARGAGRWVRLLRRLRPGLLARVALALAAVGLLPLLISSRALVGINRDAMFDELMNSHAVVARTAAERVGTLVVARRELAASLAVHPDLAEPRAAAGRELLTASLESWAELGVVALAVRNAAGGEVIRVQVRAAAEVARIDAAVAAAAGGAAPLVLSTPAGQAPILGIAVPLPGRAGQLTLLADAAPIERALDFWEAGDRAELVLVDAAGAVLAGTADSLDGFPRELVARAGRSEVHGARRFLEAGLVGAHAPVPGTPWAVLSRQASEVAEATARRMRRRSAQAVGGSLGLIAILVVVAHVTVVRPLRQLIDSQRRLAGVDGEGSRGDEIAELRASFAALETALRDRRELDEVFLGRYQVVEKISSGGMGTVFRGWDPRLDRPVALKTIRVDVARPGAAGAELDAKLVREAVMAARFSHPNIVSVYDVEDAPGVSYIAMEYVEGTTLETLIWLQGLLPVESMVPLGARIADALAAAHAHGVVHGDVKPANVLLGRDGSVKVTDFGTSQLVSRSLPDEETVFGTPGYIPPEVLSGGAMRPAGDLFALGVVLYLCLTGEQPYPGGTLREMSRRILAGDPVPPGRYRDDLPREVAEIVLALLARHPELRPAGAGQVRDDLDRLAREHGWVWAPAPGELGTASPSPAHGRSSARFIPTAPRRPTHRFS